MKIVFCYQYCTLGGCETVLSTRLHEMQSLGIDAHAIFLDGGDGEELFSDLGDSVSICRQPSAVENKLSALNPDFLVSLDTPQICTYAERHAPGAHFVLEAHSTYPQALKRLKNMSRRKLSALFTPSHAQRELVLSILGPSIQFPVEVVPNPLRPSFSAAAHASKYRRPIVIWVGRLDPHKNWRTYVEICRRLKLAGADLEYWIVGTSKTSSLEKAHLWEEIKKAGLAGRFRWLPYVQYEKMDRLLRFVACSGGCLVSTSRQESFGMAAAEAMASSCPVVVPDVGGFRDFVINHVTGFRYQPSDPQEAVDYILESVQDIQTRTKIVAMGYQRVHQQYSARQAVLKLIDALQNLGTAKTAPAPA
jgi:glycosyltransferase involved in cell wall biosynthesis